MPPRDDMKRFIRTASAEAGFAACGFARASRLIEDGERLARWVKSGRNAAMDYMAGGMEIRTNPAHGKFFPGAGTVIIFAAGCAVDEPPRGSLAAAIARYARGRDYHRVLREKINEVLTKTRGAFGLLKARVFVDSAPIMEKAWARIGGVGWTGKNSLIVTRGHGSFVVLGGACIGLDLEPDPPAPDGCGECRACIEACPTGAIGEDRTVDARLCTAFYTTGARAVEPEALRRFVAGVSVFGCDLCQEACPLSRAAAERGPLLAPLGVLRETGLREAARMEPARLQAILKSTALERIGAGRVIQNIKGYLMEVS